MLRLWADYTERLPQQLGDLDGRDMDSGARNLDGGRVDPSRLGRHSILESGLVHPVVRWEKAAG